MKPEGVSQSRWDRGIYWGAPLQLVDGCTKIKAGCQNCWSLGMAIQFKKEFVKDGEWSGRIRFNHDRLNIPRKRRNPTVYAVWNDLFHEAVKQEDISQAYEVMRDCPQHTFLVLTKRIERAANITGLRCAENIWPGTSVSTQEDADENIPKLVSIRDVLHHWLSVEPLLGEIQLPPPAWHIEDADDSVGYPVHPIDLVVIGCESGPKARFCEIENIRSVVQQCKKAAIRVFVKQVHLPKIVATTRIISDMPMKAEPPYVEVGKSYHATVNRYGAVSAITKRGLLGLKPDEFRTVGFWVCKDITKFPEDLRLREWPINRLTQKGL